MKEIHCKKCDNWTQHPEGTKCKWCGSMDTTTTNSRGGARKGAGRKPRTTPRKAITVKLEPQDAAKLRELCRADELSQANWIAKQIRRSH